MTDEFLAVWYLILRPQSNGRFPWMAQTELLMLILICPLGMINRDLWWGLIANGYSTMTVSAILLSDLIDTYYSSGPLEACDSFWVHGQWRLDSEVLALAWCVLLPAAPKARTLPASQWIRSLCGLVAMNALNLSRPPRPAVTRAAARNPGWACGRRCRIALRRAAPPQLHPKTSSLHWDLLRRRFRAEHTIGDRTCVIANGVVFSRSFAPAREWMGDMKNRMLDHFI